jgi:truncated hemoglobin YjbI
MRRLRWLAFLTLGAVLVVLAGASHAQQGTMPAGDRKVDKIVYDSLRDIINHGADLYNSGDWAGCYRLYEGALLMIRPMLDHRPKLQGSIADALRNAEADPTLARRAFVLRYVIDQIRTDVNPNPKAADKTMADKATKPPEVDTTKKAPVVSDKGKEKEKEKGSKATLWDRLGRDAGVGVVVDDLFKVVAADKKVDFTRGGKFPVKDPEMLKSRIVDFLHSLADPTFKYEGKTMKAAHAGMGITDAEFNAFLDDVEKVLTDHKVAPGDQTAIVDALERFRKDVVQPAEKKKEEEKDKPPIGGGKPDDKDKEKSKDKDKAPDKDKEKS